jgi:large subunit ribosomal protein L12e
LQEKNIKHTGNITMDDIIEVARVMRPRSCAKTLAGTCKEMLGTAQSVGCTIDHQHPQAVMAKVRTPRPADNLLQFA